jgi:hypothetical protein
MTHECKDGYRRVRLCVREDLFRAMVIIEASEGLKRYKLIEEALLMYLDSRRSFGGGLRVLTVSEELYNQLASIGNGSAEAGLRRLLEAFQNHQLVVPNTQAQSQVRVQARAQTQVQSQAESRESVGLDFLEDNPWISIIKNRHTATSTPSGF